MYTRRGRPVLCTYEIKGKIRVSSNKKTRRFLKRMAERKGTGYREAMAKFYGKKVERMNKALVMSLHKRVGGKDEFF